MATVGPHYVPVCYFPGSYTLINQSHLIPIGFDRSEVLTSHLLFPYTVVLKNCNDTRPKRHRPSVTLTLTASDLRYFVQLLPYTQLRGN